MGEFADRYRTELADKPVLDELREMVATHEVVTLVHAARDPRVNHAVILLEVPPGCGT